MRRNKFAILRVFIVLISLFDLASCRFFSRYANASQVASVPQAKKVMVVIFENTNFKDAMEQPFLSKFATDGALLTNFFAEVHPSQGNYIALTAGDIYGVKGDNDVTLDVRHLGDLLEESGKTWKVYAEDYPGNCSLRTRTGLFVRKHVPFLSFKNIQDNAGRCNSHIVEASAMAKDRAAGALPDFSLYIPNMKNDGHDTDVAFADKWFSGAFGPLLKDPDFMKDLLVVVTFDESGLLGKNHIYTALMGSNVVPGSHCDERIDHYGLLHTIENALGVGNLGQNDARAPTISGIWKE